MPSLTLTRLDGRRFASGHFGDSFGDRSEWIKETVATQFECAPDDVNFEQNADGEFATVEGKIVARII